MVHLALEGASGTSVIERIQVKAPFLPKTTIVNESSFSVYANGLTLILDIDPGQGEIAHKNLILQSSGHNATKIVSVVDKLFKDSVAKVGGSEMELGRGMETYVKNSSSVTYALPNGSSLL
ncbi:hypothetical protein DY000_02056286 [Brassica cretica]|uniref:Uncharacterized protein n=1 Tax=Brassica cretica TaxID=69181 RepID=A0ABQ7AB88_BRACR|nr:hypothetical protein DY000_02056286 [Brassica cretica]